MHKPVKIALGQMLVEPGQMQNNLERAATMIERAAQQGCDVIVLPECLDAGWTYPEASDLAEPIPGSTSQRLCAEAKRHGLMVVAGVTERSGNATYNAAVVISPVGDIVLTHRKLNELPFALDVYSVGDKVNSVDTALGRVGLAICADLRPEGNPVGHTLGLMGTRLLLSPCAWAVPPEHDNSKTPYGQEWVDPYREIAIKHQMVVVGVSNVGQVRGGEWDGWKCIGCSLAVGADGKVLAQAAYGEDAEELVIVEI